DGSCVTMHVNTTWATASGFFNCGDGENDVWYTFTMPDNKEDIISEIISIGRFGREQFEVFKGPCDNLQSIFCLNDYQFESAQVHNLTPGETYYLRAFTPDARLFEWDLCLHTPKTPPANDECPQAIPFPPLPLDGSCATVLVNTTGATGDNSESCAEVYDDDVWYTFFVPKGYTGIIIDNTPFTTYSTAGVGIYGGTCDSLILLGCYAYNESRVTGLVGGQTYFARTHTAFPNYEGKYELCFRLIPSPPANDSCIHAISYPEIPLTGEWVGLEINTLTATGDTLPACEGYADDDLWYSFVVPEGVQNITYRFDWDPYIAIELFSGTCDALELIDCYGVNEDAAFHNLISGGTYYLRVYNLDEFYFSTLYLELHVPAPLVNDDCPGRILFPPIPIDGSCSTVSGNTLDATSSNVINYCSENPPNDVWFEFTAPQDRTSVILTVTIESGIAMNFMLYEGQCDTLVPRECLYHTDVEDLSGLTPGATYYLQGHSIGSVYTTEYTLCLSVTPLPPVNDDCIKATSITGNPGVFVDPGPQTTSGATDSDLDMCYPTNQFPGNTFDVWYSFVTDEDGGDASVTIQFYEPNGAFSFFYFFGQALAGDCGDFTTLSCVKNDFNTNGYEDSMVVLHMYGLDPLTKYYFRVYPEGSSGNYAPIDFTVFAEGSALDPMTGLEDQLTGEMQSLKIEKVYPSPATSVVHVEFTSSHEADITLMLTDLLGHVVYHRTQLARQGENHFSIQASAFPPGIYFIVLEKNGIPGEVKRVVIQ
ncbi:MAG TPA: T9SS type A sorting domain-containing protein, partial [Saprospiraceae bacterium]|nr:T9SS type A sorting domain-containing protein [Saprospiraceae bacterium]